MVTKKELILENKKLKEEIENLEFAYNNLNDFYCEMENKCADLQFNNDNSIKNVDNFKFRLTLENLLTSTLEAFIEEYLKYYNESLE